MLIIGQDGGALLIFDKQYLVLKLKLEFLPQIGIKLHKIQTQVIHI